MGFWNTISNMWKSSEETAPNDLNPKFGEFKGLSKDEENAIRQSVIEEYFRKEVSESPAQVIGYDSSNSYANFVYGSLSTSKPSRLRTYRIMSEFPEIGSAVSETADEMVNKDEDGNVCRLKIKNKSKINNIRESEIVRQYEHFISLYDMDYRYHDYAMRLMTEGEIAFENVMDDKHKDHGFIGVNLIPNDSYDFLIDQYGVKHGIAVNTQKNMANASSPADMTSVQGGIQLQQPNNFGTKQTSNRTSSMHDEDSVSLSQNKNIIPLPFEQITYIESGIHSPNGLIVYPVIERARKAYRQLSLIEDAIIIYRLVRAPERLVFNVNTGKLPRARAEEEVAKMMKRFQTKKFYNPTTGSVSNDYDPFSILDSFWFPKSDGSGTDVSTVGGSVSWGEIPELEYFLRKLYNTMKIPFQRFKEGNVDITVGSDSLSRDEIRFMKHVISLQDRFSIGLTKAFVNHLKLTGLWEQYNLNQNDLKIEFTPPSLYELYIQQKAIGIKLKNYTDFVSNNAEFSKEMAMKKYLGWTDEQILENRKRREDETMFEALLKYKSANIEKNGNPFNTGE